MLTIAAAAATAVTTATKTTLATKIAGVLVTGGLIALIALVFIGIGYLAYQNPEVFLAILFIDWMSGG